MPLASTNWVGVVRWVLPDMARFLPYWFDDDSSESAGSAGDRRIVGVALGAAAIERGGVELGERRTAFQALDQVEIGDEGAPEGDKVHLLPPDNTMSGCDTAALMNYTS